MTADLLEAGASRGPAVNLLQGDLKELVRSVRKLSSGELWGLGKAFDPFGTENPAGRGKTASWLLCTCGLCCRHLALHACCLLVCLVYSTGLRKSLPHCQVWDRRRWHWRWRRWSAGRHRRHEVSLQTQTSPEAVDINRYILTEPLGFGTCWQRLGLSPSQQDNPHSPHASVNPEARGIYARAQLAAPFRLWMFLGNSTGSQDFSYTPPTYHPTYHHYFGIHCVSVLRSVSMSSKAVIRGQFHLDTSHGLKS